MHMYVAMQIRKKTTREVGFFAYKGTIKTSSVFCPLSVGYSKGIFSISLVISRTDAVLPLGILRRFFDYESQIKTHKRLK